MPGRLRVIRENIYAFEPRERYDAVVLLGAMEHLPDYEKLMAKFDGLVKPNGFVYMDFSAIRKIQYQLGRVPARVSRESFAGSLSRAAPAASQIPVRSSGFGARLRS